jgi:hypothetical protein
MGADPGASGAPPVTVAEGDPARLREQIEATRADLGDTVAALAIKADVRRQARDRIVAARQRALARRDALLGRGDGASASDKAEPSAEPRPGAANAVLTASRSAATQAGAHPLPLVAAVSAGIGFLLGRWTSP